MSKFLTWISIIIAFLVFSVGVVLIFWYPFKNKNISSNTNLYRLADNLSGDALIPDIDPSSSKVMKYFTGGDPTHGDVDYGNHPELISMPQQSDGKTRVKISAGPQPTGDRNRKMIRMVSNKMYDNGLFVISANHMPEGNGVWPSFWLDSGGGGKTWACDGEIDIIEGVNSINEDKESSRNVSTLHTSDKDGFPSCTQEGIVDKDKSDYNKHFNPICNKNDNGYSGCGCNSKSLCPNVGCGVYSDSITSFGHGFNNNGGGTYACELTSEGAITIWFFQAGTEPKDLLEDNPNPDSWPSTNRTKFKPCPGQFANLAMTLNTTLCGDWAGSDKTFKNPDQTCTEYIKTADLTNAYWSIEYIKVFIKN